MVKDELENENQGNKEQNKEQNLLAWGYLEGNSIRLSEGKFMELYNNNFYGEPDSSGDLFIMPEEAALLVERGRIKIYSDQNYVNELSLGEYIDQVVSNENSDFWVKYLVYKDLRSRGYVVRAGYGAGKLVPYRKYPRGARPNTIKSDSFIYPFSEGSSIEPHEFDLMVKQAQSNRKSLLLGIVDRSGDVTYYKASEYGITDNLEKFEWKDKD